MLHCATKGPHQHGLYKRLQEAWQDRPPKLYECAEHLKIQFKASFNFFMARALTVFEAGLALKTQGSLVNGLMPFFAGVAAFFFSFKFNMPASLKLPFFLISAQATPKRASTTPFTCLFFNPLVSATDAMTCDCVSAPDFMALAFIAFMAGAIVALIEEIESKENKEN